MVIALIVVSAVLSLIGAILLAWLHGIGFSVFGFKEAKTSFKKRYVFQLLTMVVSTILTWGIFEVLSDGGVMALLSHGAVFAIFGIAVFVSVVWHLSLSGVTFVLATKPNWKPAVLTPVIGSGLIFLLMLSPSIPMVMGSQ